ncbi:GLYCOSYL HYDROLASE FAMILY 10 PROTEIN [Salix viminalis]|uniref:GLYCOSYL HYDROLASE FAMILY 10 PROTEIN n=1 Tax=Salix viminalis TaxID=40686 RepID=A0A9Q0NKL7_SALVM|nr:GLYCOSYL HYDROLASE FAMILY 10 PROTEIN [Salix viminalis]
MSKYKEETIHCDVSNEMLHFDVYEQRLGPDATLNFYEIAYEADPLATLFLNEFKVVETCVDVNAAVDTYIAQIREPESGGASNEWNWPGETLSKLKFPLMKAILDKLATLKLPI